MAAITLDYTAPGLLFPAISLFFVAFTQRFLSLSQLIRTLLAEAPEKNRRGQLNNFILRIKLIRFTQIACILSFVLCVICMLGIALSAQTVAQSAFLASLVALLTALVCTGWEVLISVEALKLEIEAQLQKKR